MSAICRGCGNSGVGITGKACVCKHGDRSPGELPKPETEMSLVQFYPEMSIYMRHLLHWICIRTELLEIEISNRPAYCDRGRFKVLIVDSFDQRRCSIDHQDGFPRYYFDMKSMLIEIEHFIKAKKQNFVHAELQHFDNEGNVITKMVLPTTTQQGRENDNEC